MQLAQATDSNLDEAIANVSCDHCELWFSGKDPSLCFIVHTKTKTRDFFGCNHDRLRYGLCRGAAFISFNPDPKFMRYSDGILSANPNAETLTATYNFDVVLSRKS